ncbi:hypothetical protein [Streptomonospora salina]|uniref:Uncharacterized protein n=1 Tax=Streptomonospora salina TaxID=104205 RepID=A0A841E540_9ACTN|nr:hypothetical protein [Streptomonospora salina]MBB5998255.1 hypothetical protein [Streptomonospora salina]
MPDRIERPQRRIVGPWAESSGRRSRRAARTRPYVRRLPSTPQPKPYEVAPRAALVRPYVLAERPQWQEPSEAAPPPAPVRPYVRAAARDHAQHGAEASRLGIAVLADIANTQAATRNPAGDTLDDVRAALSGPLRKLIAQRPDLGHSASAAGAEHTLAGVQS